MNLELYKLSKLTFIFLICFILTILFPVVVWANNENTSPLQKSHAEIVSDYPSVSHISAAALFKQSTDKVLIFDVRELKEYDVSHLSGAFQVDPGISVSEFMTQFDEDWNGKTVVFYCSVGRRSSILAERVQAALKAKGVKAVYNLEAGIFEWHNQSLPLINARGETDYVHPYNAFWKRLMTRKDLARYKP